MLLVALVPPPTDPSIASIAFAGILGEGWEVHAYRHQEEVPDEIAAEARAVVAAASQTVDAQILKRAPNVVLVQVPGHGFDHINLADARAAGVPVATVASSGAEAHTVAEMAILLAGAASRRMLDGDRLVREGGWGQQTMLQRGVFELAGKTIGLVGLGRIGREVATRARGFAMRVLYHDAVRPGEAAERDLGVEYRDLDPLLAEADIVSLHLPLTSGTRGIIGEAEIGRMKPTAVLINTARGPLVDSAALAKALTDGRIRAAGIDVFDHEPPRDDDPLRSAPNVVLSPHVAGVTAESIMRVLQAALENCRRAVAGEPVHDLIGDDDEPH